MKVPVGDITRLLGQIAKGDSKAQARLIELVLGDLRLLAAACMRKERPDHLLQPTALVNEFYLKLVQQRRVNLKNRAHFFGVAAIMMRRILVDYARTHLAQKRGAGQQPLSLDKVFAFSMERSRQLLALDEALIRLQKMDPRQSHIVELRFFGGLNIAEIAEVLHDTPDNIKQEWSSAKAWLSMELKEE